MDRNETTQFVPRPTSAFIGASWTVLGIGSLAFVIGLWNSGMTMITKGFYFSLLLYGLFGVVSLQKAVRDRIEGVPVTAIYYGLSWVAVGAAVLLLTIGLWESPDLMRSEKGFYGMAYVLALFAAVAVQKNVRDLEFYPKPEKEEDNDDFMQSALDELAG